MKKLIVLILVFIPVFAFAQKAIQDRQLTGEELKKVEILDSIQTSFTLDGIGGTLPPTEANIKKQAYIKLLEEAQKKHKGMIDVKNITISENSKKMKLSISIVGVVNFEYTYTASGSVISTYSSATRLSGITSQIVNTLKGNKNATVAIFDFTNVNRKKSVLGRYLAEQVSNYFFQSSELNIVERTQIDKILEEQEFGMTGFVDDASAVKIGHILGADAVTIGTLTKVGDKISVTIKIVNANTSVLLSSGSTEIDGTEYIEMYNELLE
jgi:TolB-like protein